MNVLLLTTLDQYELTIMVLAYVFIFQITYFQNALFEWTLLSDDIKDSSSIFEFKRKLLAIIEPLGKSNYDIHNVKGILLLKESC